MCPHPRLQAYEMPSLSPKEPPFSFPLSSLPAGGSNPHNQKLQAGEVNTQASLSAVQWEPAASAFLGKDQARMLLSCIQRLSPVHI